MAQCWCCFVLLRPQSVRLSYFFQGESIHLSQTKRNPRTRILFKPPWEPFISPGPAPQVRAEPKIQYWVLPQDSITCCQSRPPVLPAGMTQQHSTSSATSTETLKISKYAFQKCSHFVASIPAMLRFTTLWVCQVRLKALNAISNCMTPSCMYCKLRNKKKRFIKWWRSRQRGKKI